MFKKIIGISMLISLLLFNFQCKKDEKITKNKDADSTNINTTDSIKVVPKIEIKYTSFIFPKGKKDSAMSVFLEKYSEIEQYNILALNRLDTKNKWRADTLIIPEHLDVDFLAYSPFPMKIDTLKSVDKIAFFSYSIHAFAIYENGIQKKWGPTSMGKKSTPTNIGLSYTNWKKELAISSVNSSWKLRWNFNVFNQLGIGWHQYDLPGFHASHSCMRLLEEDAKYLYYWANGWKLDETGSKVLAKGTPVYIFGETDFKAKPWYQLLKNPKANSISEADLNKEIAPFVSKILEEQSNSIKFRNLSEVTVPNSTLNEN